MNFIDKTIVQLADSNQRAGVFSDEGLKRIIQAGYSVADMELKPPYSPVFEEFSFGLYLTAQKKMEGLWEDITDHKRKEARFTITGGEGKEPFFFDAFWKGQIAARGQSSLGRITEISNGWVSMAGIDTEIINSLGALPPKAEDLEKERRKIFLNRIGVHFSHSPAASENLLDSWLADTGVGTVSEFIINYIETKNTGTMTIKMEPFPGFDLPIIIPFPVAIGIFIRETPFPLSSLIAESKNARDLWDRGGEALVRPSYLRLRFPLIVLWILKESVFDDPEWPGGTAGMSASDLRKARIGEAGHWLVEEGIGLVTIP